MLLIKNISKSFGNVKALQGVSFAIQAGEVHALCGENGAGKSTLMNILVGNLSADAGEIELDNSPFAVSNNFEARQRGINIVYQERSLIDSLTVAENVYPNPPLKSFGRIDFDLLFQQTQTLLTTLKIHDFLPQTLLEDLSPAQKQLVEIAKALATNPRVLLLDEPTASLADRETEILFEIIRGLKSKGVAVVYISHRMAEIKAIADRVSVLKDGQFQGTLLTKNATIDVIIKLMVGRDLFQKKVVSHATNEVVLSVENLSGKGFSDVSFQLNKGEILGFGGLVGAGRTELAKAIFGANTVEKGSIIRTKLLRINTPKAAIAQGIAYLPEERKALGIFPELSVADNISVAALDTFSSHNFLNFKKIKANVQDFIEQLSIKTPSAETPIGALSGGNQQKVMLARWLNTKPAILIVDEPTHGVDVGAKAEIYEILKNLTAQGVSIVLISSDLPELRLLSDRVAVMQGGKLKNILNQNQATEERIMALAAH